MFPLFISSGAPRMISEPRTSKPAEAARIDRGRAGREGSLSQLRGGQHRQVPQIARVPQDDGLHDAVVHVRFVDVRQREADHVHVRPPRLPHGFGRSGHGRRRNRHHELDGRIDTQDRLRLGERLVAVVVARANRRELQVRVLLGEPLPDVGDPLVLIRGAERAGDDRELATASEQPRRFVGQRRRQCLQASPD